MHSDILSRRMLTPRACVLYAICYMQDALGSHGPMGPEVRGLDKVAPTKPEFDAIVHQ